MPALRRQAQAWYDQNLVEPKTTVTMKDGTVVGFNGRGKRETTYGRKGDILLRSVPAIPAIIENGEIVHREAGDERHSHVLERVVIAAPIELAGKIHNLAVAVNRTRDGDWHYDLNTDNRFVGKDSYAGRPSYQDLGERGAEPLLSALEGTSRSINIFEWASDGNAPAESGSIRAMHSPAGRSVKLSVD